MAKAASIYAPQDWSQRKQRADATFYDQYGREYFGTVELKTGDVVGLMQPQFTAPLMPEQKYLERVPRKPYDLFWNIDRQIADIRGAREEWEKEGRTVARKLHGQAYDNTAEFGQDVLDIIGEPPQAIEPYIAARQGDKWVLGLSNKVNMKIVRFFTPEQLDVKVQREMEKDYTGDYDDEPKSRGGRVPVKSNRPQARALTKGEGQRKAHPSHQAGEKPARARFPHGHPKAGQFMPAEPVTA